jgi:transcription elongation factor GreB
MSKAFTRETDEPRDDGTDDDDEQAARLPVGKKNYLTPAGYRSLLDEQRRLVAVERPQICATVQWAASNGDRSENADYQYGKRRLREIDRRLRFIQKRLDAAEVVDPEQRTGCPQVFFGATVTVADEDGEENTYAIVGVDEIDLARGRITWVSPLALALLKHEEGDTITVPTPRGPRELEIVKVEYRKLD